MKSREANFTAMNNGNFVAAQVAWGLTVRPPSRSGIAIEKRLSAARFLWQNSHVARAQGWARESKGGQRMRKLALSMAAIAALGISQPASAEAWCNGTVSASWVDVNGNFFIAGSWRGTHTQMCNVKTECKGVTPDVCATWMAKLDAAVSLGRSVVVNYPVVTDCATLPTYSAAPSPTYVMLL